MTQLDRILKGIECCSAAVRCNQCPYNKYRHEENARIDDCQKEMMLEIFAETGIDGTTAWWVED